MAWVLADVACSKPEGPSQNCKHHCNPKNNHKTNLDKKGCATFGTALLFDGIWGGAVGLFLVVQNPGTLFGAQIFKDFLVGPGVASVFAAHLYVDSIATKGCADTGSPKICNYSGQSGEEFVHRGE